MTNPDTNLDWVEQAWGTGLPPAAQDDLPRAHARDCAVESGPGKVPPAVPSPVSPLAPARSWLTQTLVPAITTAADKKGTLARSQPPTFIQAMTRHKECAAHYDNQIVGGGRMLYGFVHTLTVKPVLNYLEWATASPLSLTIHVLIGAAVWAALLLGGYL